MKIVLLPFLLSATALAAAAADPSPPVSTLEQAVGLSLQRHPALVGGGAGVRAAEARAVQAGVAPNPRLSAEVEDFGGEGARSGFDAAQTTLSLEQTFEGGGKRGARRAEGEAARGIAQQELDALRLDIVHDATVRFAETLAAQQRGALREQSLAAARTVLAVVSNRVSAGKDRPAQAARAQAEAALAGVEAAHAKRTLSASRRALAALWSGSPDQVGALEGTLAGASADPGTNALLAALAQSPDSVLLERRVGAADAAIRAGRAASAPDWSLGAGVRHAAEDDGVSFVAIAGLDLPVRDRKTGALRAALADAEQARAGQQAGQLGRRTELLTTHEAWLAAREAEQIIHATVVPADEQAFEATQTAYATGKASYLELEEARRSLIAAEERHLDAQLEVLVTRAALERLAGRPLTQLVHGVR